MADGPALKNGAPIAVTAGRAGRRLAVAVDETLVKKFDPALQDEIERARYVPSLAYRLAMVADGRLDGTIVRRNSHDWDLAAADLILERAGGRVVDLDGRRLVYNRPELKHDMLVAGANHAVESLLPQLLHPSSG